MAKNKQSMKNVKVGGTAKQMSDVDDISQTMEDIEATSADQKIESQPNSLRLGNVSANGRRAVIALGVIVLAYLAYRVFIG